MGAVSANVTFLIPLKEYLHGQGVSTREVFDRAGVDIAILADPGRFVPLEDICRVFDAASDMTDDPCFGIHYGEAYPMGGSGVHGQLILSAPSVGDMLKSAIAYAELTISPMTSGLHEDANETTYLFTIPGAGGGQTFARFGAFLQATLVTRIRRAVGASWHPIRTTFVHKCPTDNVRREYVRVFGENIAFEAASLSVTMANETFRHPNPVEIEGLHGTVQQVADRELGARREATGFSGQVIRMILQHLNDEKSIHLDAIASALGTSSRSLQLRLKQEGVTFEQVVNNVRLRMAEEMLGGTTLPLGEIAHRLGFAELSGFTRWSVRHFHMPPSAYREHLRGRAQ